MSGLPEELLCAIDDPLRLALSAALGLFAVAVLRSVIVHGTKHATLHWMAGSDLILTVLIAVALHALRIVQKIQCVKGPLASAIEAAYYKELSFSLTILVCGMGFLILTATSERFAFAKDFATPRQIIQNLMVGFVVTFFSISVIAQEWSI